MDSAALTQAKEALSRLPILGPAFWLYARDPVKKYTFAADIDWMLMPPIVLDQCRLYSKDGIPHAFITWAFVSDAVDARLREGHPRIAPHEWNSGEHLWLIDVVTPFGHREETLKELHASAFPERRMRALTAEPGEGGGVTVREWPPVGAGGEK